MDCRKLCTPDQNQQETLNPTDSLPIPDTGMAVVYTGVYNPRPYFTELPHLIFFFLFYVCGLPVCMFWLWRQGLTMEPWLSWNLLHKPSWPQTHRDMPVSAITKTMCQYTQLAYIHVKCTAHAPSEYRKGQWILRNQSFRRP